MRANNNCTKKLVNDTAKNMREALYNISSVVVENLLSKQVQNGDISPLRAADLSEQGRIFTSKFLEALNPMSSEYNRRKYLEKSSYLVEPRKVLIRERIIQKLQGSGKTIGKLKSDYMQVVNLKSTLENWFSNPDVSANLILQSQVQHSEYISTPVTAGYMEHIYNVLGEDFIAIELHGDDFDPNNGMGPHKKAYELCVIGGCVKNMTEMYQSANVCKFLLAVGYSSDMEADYYSTMHEEIVKEFERCEKITVVFHNEIREMPVVLFFFSGDYLAIKKQLGWHIIWRSGKPCNVCEIEYGRMLTAFKDDTSLLRNVDSHNLYAEKAKTETNRAFNGVKFIPKIVRPDIQSLQFFHPATNLNLDIMHQWDEGKAKITMYQILRIMIFEEKFFTLDMLNEFIDNFPVGLVYKHLRLATLNITSTTERNKNNKIKPMVFSQNAAETHFLVRMFGFIIAQLLSDLPENIFTVHRLRNSNVFKLWVSLTVLQSYIFAPRIPKTEIRNFAELYEKHQELREEVMGEVQIVFKDHPGVHLPHFIERFGMPTYYKCNQYEATYASMKSYCHFNKNHKNVPLSVALSHEYSRSIALLEHKHIKDRFICDKSERTQIIKLNGFQKISEKFGLDVFDFVYVSNKIVFGGTSYESGMSVLLDFLSEIPYFGKIEKFIYFDQKWLVLVKFWRTISHVEWLQMYEVDEEDRYEVVQLDKLKDYHPLESYPFSRKLFIALPYKIFE